MIHNKNESFICEHCGVDFTHRQYAERIGHSNMTSNFNIIINRFDSAESPEELEDEIKDAIGVNDDRTPYESVVENINCLILALENGIILYDYDAVDEQDEWTTQQFPKYADIVREKAKLMKTFHNAKINKKIDKLVIEYEQQFRSLKESLIK